MTIIATKLTQKANSRGPDGFGYYWITEPKSVILCCPVCGLRMFLLHTIISENPLSVTPSVVGPHNANQDKNCGHHFNIKNGEVTPC